MLRMLQSSSSSKWLKQASCSASRLLLRHTRRRSFVVVAALSGGVDSSVVASLLFEKQQQQQQQQQLDDERDDNKDGVAQIKNPTMARNAFQVAAVHSTSWNASSHDDDSVAQKGCTSESDWKDVKAVVQHLLSSLSPPQNNNDHDKSSANPAALDSLSSQLPLHRVNCEAAYWHHVFEPFIDNMQRGVMGNPDMGCNRYVKFGTLREQCLSQFGTDSLLATGHYARLWHRHEKHSNLNDNNGDPRLKWLELGAASRNRSTTTRPPIPKILEEEIAKDPEQFDWIPRWGQRPNDNNHNELPPILMAAADTAKDQSYFLADCYSHQFSNVIFPLGDFFKSEKVRATTGSNDYHQTTVRELAQKFALPTANKRESMGICFVGKRPDGFRQFVHEYLPLPTQPVRFVDVETNQTVWESNEYGHACVYALGQGAKLGGCPTKYFVQSLQLSQNSVLVAPGTHHPSLYTDQCTLQRVHWMMTTNNNDGTTCLPPDPLLQQMTQPTYTLPPLTSSAAASHTNINTSASVLSMRLQCRIRHLGSLVDCTLVMTPPQGRPQQQHQEEEAHSPAAATILFDQPLRGVTPGQYVAFYTCNGLVCLGGGPIAQVAPSLWHRSRSDSLSSSQQEENNHQYDDEEGTDGLSSNQDTTTFTLQ